MHTLAVIALVVVLVIVLIGCGVYVQRRRCRCASAERALCPAQAADPRRTAYSKYRITFPEINAGPIMQIADVELLRKTVNFTASMPVNITGYNSPDTLWAVRQTQTHRGGVYCPVKNRIYLVPYGQDPRFLTPFMFYIDCDTGRMMEFRHGTRIVPGQYSGGVYCPVQKRIYFVPCMYQLQQSGQPSTAILRQICDRYRFVYHYIDCRTGTVKVYEHFYPVAGGYSGGAYDPVGQRIFFAPFTHGDLRTTWVYLDCKSGRLTSYAHNVAESTEVNYDGAVYVPAQHRIYFIPSKHMEATTWHYVDCNRGDPVVCSYQGMQIHRSGNFAQGVYSPAQQRIYLVPMRARDSQWYFIDCSGSDDGSSNACGDVNVVAYSPELSVDALSDYSNADTRDFYGGVYSPSENRIYLMPHDACDKSNWMYVDCNNGAVVPYAHGITDVLSAGSIGTYSQAYMGGVYSPSQDRIYFVPAGRSIDLPPREPYVGNGRNAQTLYYIDTSPPIIPIAPVLHGGPYARGLVNSSPGGEGAASALDGDSSTKYLNFGGTDTGLEFEVDYPTDPTGVYLTSGNDHPDRDPVRLQLEGLTDSGDYNQLADVAVPPFSGRGQEQLVMIPPDDLHGQYVRFRITFTVRDGADAMQVADIQLRDSFVSRVPPRMPPQPYAPPGLPNLSPWHEQVANALDADPDTKYLNFGGAGTGLVLELPDAAVVDAVALTSGNDSPNRDPVRLKLEGLSEANVYEEVADVAVPPFQGRKHRQVVMLG
jgi:hypothetical protein